MAAPGGRGRLRDTDHLTTEAVVTEAPEKNSGGGGGMPGGMDDY